MYKGRANFWLTRGQRKRWFQFGQLFCICSGMRPSTRIAGCRRGGERARLRHEGADKQKG